MAQHCDVDRAVICDRQGLRCAAQSYFVRRRAVLLKDAKDLVTDNMKAPVWAQCQAAWLIQTCCNWVDLTIGEQLGINCRCRLGQVGLIVS